MDNDLDKIKKHWSKLSHIETLQISLLVRLYIIRKKLSEIHPRNLVIPACIIQVITFAIITIIQPEKIIEILSISNLIITSIAITPMTMRKKKFHYIN